MITTSHNVIPSELITAIGQNGLQNGLWPDVTKPLLDTSDDLRFFASTFVYNFGMEK